MTRFAWAVIGLTSAVLVTSCGETRNEIVVKVETDDGRTTEVRKEVSAEQAAAVRKSLREKNEG